MQHLGLVDLATHILREVVLGVVRQPASRHLGAVAKLRSDSALRACSSGEMAIGPPDHHAPVAPGGWMPNMAWRPTAPLLEEVLAAARRYPVSVVTRGYDGHSQASREGDRRKIKILASGDVCR